MNDKEKEILKEVAKAAIFTGGGALGGLGVNWLLDNKSNKSKLIAALSGATTGLGAYGLTKADFNLSTRRSPNIFTRAGNAISNVVNVPVELVSGLLGTYAGHKTYESLGKDIPEDLRQGRPGAYATYTKELKDAERALDALEATKRNTPGRKTGWDPGNSIWVDDAIAEAKARVKQAEKPLKKHNTRLGKSIATGIGTTIGADLLARFLIRSL